ncbi:MAG: hypothetical protein AAF591_02830 [Verrucomicrobiota bacterium]
MKRPTKTVALADPRWAGHHPTYFKEFFASMVRLGARVIALCPDPAGFRETAATVCDEFGLDVDEWIVTEELKGTKGGVNLLGLEHDPASTVVRWWTLRRAMRRAEARSGWTAGFVFLAWLDSYLRFMPSAAIADRMLGRPWGGLYFRNHHLARCAEQGSVLNSLRRIAKGDFNLRADSCRVVGVLDERFTDELEALSGKPVLQFPDITDETRLDGPSAFTCEVLEKAKGRKIIGVIGLERRKGFLTLLKAALRAAEEGRPWYFVFGGTLSETTLSDEELKWLREVDERVNVEGEFDNIHLDLNAGPVPDTGEFNSLISSFDVVFAAYEDFHGSSNALTKAALFERPILASRGECIEARVNEFGMGICMDQGDVDQCMVGIEKLLERKDWNDQPLVPRFDAYRSRHSRERLDDVFREALALE